ncbi:MAG TPA: hypothetical protein VEZ42_11275, partial [Pseudonocardia sp.]|nr:hypothetical protein [Pseudonocardia sp.]
MTEHAATGRWRASAALLPGMRPPAGVGQPRSTAEFLHRSAQSYAALGRAAIGVLAALIAPFAGPPVGVPVTAAVSAALIGWSLVYSVRMRRAPRTWLWVVDVAVLCAVGLAQPLLVAPGLTGSMAGWVTPLLSFAVVALQWHTRPRTGFAAAGAVGAALVVGAALTPGIGIGQAFLLGGVWTIVEAGLSRLLWQLVQRGGRIADEVMAAGFAQERATALAAARRADQRLHWSTVHDTAASTLLMIGLGEVRGDEPWLAEQVHRDIVALADEPVADDEPRDLAGVLGEVARRAAVEVALELPPGAAAPVPGPVATAIEGAVGEALENVRRH